MKVKPLIGYALVLLNFLPSGIASALTYTYVDVMYPGAAETIVEDINDSGMIVGTYGASLDLRGPVQEESKAFVRMNANWQTLDVPGATSSSATAVNNSGLVGGYYYTSGQRFHGFVYNGASYVDVLPPGAEEAVVSDIAENGVIIGTYSESDSLSASNADSVRGFTAVPNGAGGYQYNLFDFPDASGTFGSGINGNGTTVGTAFVSSVFGAEYFGYVLPNHEYRYPRESIFPSYTKLVSVNEQGVILGISEYFELSNPNVAGRTSVFVINAADFAGPNPPTPQDIEIPCPTCAYIIHLNDGSEDEPGRRAAANLNNNMQIVGFYDNNDGILRGFIGTPTVSGDYNNNGTVDAADYALWRKNPNTYNGNPAGYNTWRANFGRPPGSGSDSTGSSGAAVPEPTASVLLLSTAVGLSFLRRRTALPSQKVVRVTDK